MAEIRTTAKQQLVFNMLTGTYDYKPAEQPVSPREKSTSTKSLSTKASDGASRALSPRSEEKKRKHKKTKKRSHKKSKEVNVTESKSEPTTTTNTTAITIPVEEKATEPEIEEITYEIKSGNEVKINGEWKGNTCGGCLDNLTWRNNPQIFFWLSSQSGVVELCLRTKESIHAGIGFYVFECPLATPKRVLTENLLVGKSKFVIGINQVSTSFTIKKTGCIYAVVPSTYVPRIEMTFSLIFTCSDKSVSAQLISNDHEWQLPILGSWSGASAGGCGNEETVVNNPQYLIKVTSKIKVGILLLQFQEDFDSIGFYIVAVDSPVRITNPSIFYEDSKLIVNPDFGDPNEFYIESTLEPGNYIIVPCTFDPRQNGDFQIRVMCESLLEVTKL